MSIFYILSPYASAEYEFLMKRKNEKKEKKERGKTKIKIFFLGVYRYFMTYSRADEREGKGITRNIQDYSW